MVHESEYPGDNIPPLPPVSTWFSHLEEVPDDAETPSRRKRRKQAELDQRRQQAGDNVEKGGGEDSEQEQQVKAEGEDIAINSEKTSLRCPITLLRFKDPVTSTKCPHSFERSAIEDMIKRGGTNRRGGRHHAGGVKGRVQCPVCTAQLTLKDLTTDPVLVRRVRRANEMDAREDDDDDSADEEDRDVMLEAETRRKKKSLPIKTEKTRSPSSERSMVPDTQFETLSDNDDDEDDDNEA